MYVDKLKMFNKIEQYFPGIKKKIKPMWGECKLFIIESQNSVGWKQHFKGI